MDVGDFHVVPLRRVHECTLQLSSRDIAGAELASEQRTFAVREFSAQSRALDPRRSARCDAADDFDDVFRDDSRTGMRALL